MAGLSPAQKLLLIATGMLVVSSVSETAATPQAKSAEIMAQIAGTGDVLELYCILQGVTRDEFVARSARNRQQAALAGKGYDAVTAYGREMFAIVETGTDRTPYRTIADVVARAATARTATDTMANELSTDWLTPSRVRSIPPSMKSAATAMAVIGGLAESGILSLFGPGVSKDAYQQNTDMDRAMFVGRFLETRSIPNWNLKAAERVLAQDGKRLADDETGAMAQAQAVLQMGTRSRFAPSMIGKSVSELKEVPTLGAKAMRDADSFQDWIDYRLPAQTYPGRYSTIAVRFGPGFTGRSLGL